MCGLFRVVTSQSTLPIATLAFDFRSGEGRGNISAPSSLCFQNMDERLAGRIVLKYHSSCWFSLFLLLVFHSPVISEGNNSFRFWNQKFLLFIRWIHKAEIILRLCIYSRVSRFYVLHLLNHVVYILNSHPFCSRYIDFLKLSAHYVPKSTTHKQAETTLRRSIIIKNSHGVTLFWYRCWR